MTRSCNQCQPILTHQQLLVYHACQAVWKIQSRDAYPRNKK